MSPPQPLFRAVAGLDPHPSLPGTAHGRPPAVHFPFGLVVQRPEPPVAGAEITTTVFSELHRPVGSSRTSLRARRRWNASSPRFNSGRVLRDRKPARPIALVRSAWSVGLCTRTCNTTGALAGGRAFESLRIPSYSFHSTRRTEARGPVRAPHNHYRTMSKERHDDNSPGTAEYPGWTENRWGVEISDREISTDNPYVRRKSNPSSGRWARFRTDNHGYEKWECYAGDGSMEMVQVHRLLAVAEWGFEAVRDNHVHHKNKCTFDNRPENLEPLTPKAHGEEHSGEPQRRWYTDEELLEWVESFVDTFGVAPAVQDLRGWPGPTAETYIRRFGSFPKAVRAAGYEPRGHQ